MKNRYVQNHQLTITNSLSVRYYLQILIGKDKMSTQEIIEAFFDYIEILSNPKTMDALRKSEEDIKEGRVKEITSAADLLVEL